ncbi:MAG: 1,4-dihydroxy-2-naphthoate octaprenyltransferase [Halobacteriovoraceae bacterium]|nr:1,4-dihydroxy-2-naphthoate octaprenyltransferase [Halobacteriovoraceae bacterium]
MNNNPWKMAIRPKTLPAGAGPVILGLALSYKYLIEASQQYTFSIPVALTTLLCAILLQVSSNLINDYYDGVKGLDDEKRLGPPRATSLGLLPSYKVRNGFLLTLLVSFLLGLYLMIIGGVPIIIIGLSSLFFSWAYTGGPFPLSYFGLGELFAFIFFGPVAVWGTWFLQTQGVFPHGPALLWGSSLGLLSAALMGVNNLRDRYGDKEKGKHTLATILGGRAMRKLIFLMILTGQILAQSILWKSESFHSFYALVGLTPLFIFSKVWWGLLRYTEGRELNHVLATVGKYIFLYSITYSLILLLL